MQLTKHWAATLDEYVIDLAWSPDGTQLAAASTSGPVSIFASLDGAKLHTLPGHENGTNCLAWQPQRAAPSENEGKMTENRGQGTGDGQKTNEGERTTENGPVVSLLATGGQDGTVKWWDAKNGQHLFTSKLGSAWVDHLAWRPMQPSDIRPPSSDLGPPTSGLGPSSSDSLAAVAGRDLFFLHPDGSIKHRMKPAPKTITALAWQPAGGCAAVAYLGGVCLWDADDFHAQKEFPYNNGIHGLVWSPDSKWLVSGNQDPSVHLWVPEENAELHMSGYESKVKHLSFDYTSHWLATGGGRDACVWDCSGEGPEGREPAMFPHDAPVCALAFQHEHGLLASASQDGVVQLWSPGRKQPLRATVKMPVAATKLAWSPDDRLLAIGSEKGTVYVLKCEA